MNGQNHNAWKTALFLATIGVTILGLCLGFQEIARLRENNPITLEYGWLMILWGSGWWKVISFLLTPVIFVTAFILSFVKDQKAWGATLVLAWTIFTGVVGMLLWINGKLFMLGFPI